MPYDPDAYRAHRAAHHEEVLERERWYRERNADKIRDYQRAYRQSPLYKIKRREYIRRYRAKKKAEKEQETPCTTSNPNSSATPR